MGLKDLRLAKGYSRTELAKVSGIRYQKIRDIEVGIIKPENITLKTALLFVRQTSHSQDRRAVSLGQGHAAGGLLPPVALDSDVYVIYRRKPVKAKAIFIGINADRLFFFNVLRGNIKANFQTYQFTENDIGRSVFLTLEEAEKAVA